MAITDTNPNFRHEICKINKKNYYIKWFYSNRSFKREKQM